MRCRGPAAQAPGGPEASVLPAGKRGIRTCSERPLGTLRFDRPEARSRGSTGVSEGSVMAPPPPAPPTGAVSALLLLLPQPLLLLLGAGGGVCARTHRPGARRSSTGPAPTSSPPASCGGCGRGAMCTACRMSHSAPTCWQTTRAGAVSGRCRRCAGCALPAAGCGCGCTCQTVRGRFGCQASPADTYYAPQCRQS